MPIKKSILEKKWYYRVAKILFLLIPIMVVIFLFLNNQIDVSNLPNLFKGNVSDILKSDIVYLIGGIILYFIVICAIWRIFLYIIFGGLDNDTRKIGGNVMQPVNPAPQSTPAKIIGPIIVVIFCVAVFAIASSQTNPFQAHTYGVACKTSAGKTGLYGTNGQCYTCSGTGTAVTNPVNNCSDGIAGVYCCNNAKKDGENTPGCISTGCGSAWYCSGSYYLGGQQIRVNGCLPVQARDIYPSWSGTCRQCP